LPTPGFFFLTKEPSPEVRVALISIPGRQEIAVADCTRPAGRESVTFSSGNGRAAKKQRADFVLRRTSQGPVLASLKFENVFLQVIASLHIQLFAESVTGDFYAPNRNVHQVGNFFGRKVHAEVGAQFNLLWT
jgi:hypothetical protein